jgi:sulfate adenylyltransferase subunit 2
MTSSIEYLNSLESESIYLIREAILQSEKSCLLFSGGKDSVVLAHLVMKAFFPAKVPVPLVHIDTGHNFKETISFRDDFIKKYNLDLSVFYVQDSIDRGDVPGHVPGQSRNSIQSITLKNAIESEGYDVLLGGARRDEEKARAKERFCSLRDPHGGWNPTNQKPEIWNLFNFTKKEHEHLRVFPLSNWTENDIWSYIGLNKIEVSSLYYSHEREVFDSNGVLLPKESIDYLNFTSRPSCFTTKVRFRTVGDITCTGATESNALNINQIIKENQESKYSERGARADDMVSSSAMEDRKSKGYF